MKYKNWTIKYFPIGSQNWKATRFGVSICANTKELLKKMIDYKIGPPPPTMLDEAILHERRLMNGDEIDHSND